MDAKKTKTWTVLEILQWTTTYFQDKGIEGSRLDAECLLAHTLDLRRLDLYLQFDRPLTLDEQGTFRAFVLRRGQRREPLAYILGEKEFWSRPFKVTPDVLIPRPETEHLVEAALARLDDTPKRILDIGTGSGAIAVALAAEKPDVRVVAVDLSSAAIEVARYNAERNQVLDRIELRMSDCFSALDHEMFDMVVSNPPYIATSARTSLSPEVQKEPAMALFAENDGLEVYKRIIAAAPTHLNDDGHLLFEIGHTQASAVEALLVGGGFASVEVLKDYAGLDRVVCARMES